MQSVVPAKSAYSRQGLDLSRLSAAFAADREALEPFRANRVELLRQVCGKHYGERGTPEELPINLLYKYVTTIARTLIPHEPRCLMRTGEKRFVPVVDGIEQYVNEEARRQYLGDEIGKVVVDALVSIGIMQVAITTPADSAAVGYSQKVGTPSAKRVSLDDWVWDTHARDPRQCSYMGHRYRPCLDTIRDDPAYGAARKDLQASDDDPTNHDGDRRLFEMVAGDNTGSGDTEFEERVDLWQLYFPRYKTICIVSDDQIRGHLQTGTGRPELEPLLVKEWVGPDCGPYHFLGMFWATDLLMPIAPLPQLWPMHVLVNNCYRKLMDQAERQKTLVVADTAAGEDAQKVRRELDGGVVLTANAERIKQMAWGGPDPNNVAFVDAAQYTFNQIAGNLDLLGGSAPQAKTATQEKLLNANSSRAITDMQMRTNSFTAGVFRAFAELHYNHPESVMRVTKEPKAAPEEAFERAILPHPRFSGAMPDQLSRDFPFDRMKVELDPYSMQYTSPQEQGQAIRDMWINMFLPMMPLAQQQGVTADLNELIRLMAKYFDIPDLSRIFNTTAPPSEEAAGAGSGGSHERLLAPSTSRTYERVSRSETTPEGAFRSRQMALMGQNPGGNAASGGQGGRPY